VGSVQPVGNFAAQRKHLLRIQRTSGDSVLQRHAIKKLHHHEAAAVFLADVVNGTDVGMVQR
jgi:hypothetical protein